MAASSSSTTEQGTSYPNPNVQGNPYIYLAVYSSVPVYEMMVRGIGVMRRRSDSYLNATQILKVAGVDKGKRTKILEKDIALGVHEKVQGGYGRYQGTWIPFERAVELANAFGVSHLLSPLFDYTPPPPPVSLGNNSNTPIINRYSQPTPTPPNAAYSQDDHGVSKPLVEASESSAHKRGRESGGQGEGKRARRKASDATSAFNANGANGSAALVAEEAWKLRRSTQAPAPSSHPEEHMRVDRHRTALKSIFGLENEHGGGVPDLTTVLPGDIDPDTPIDENLHTALHWAAALARISIVRALVDFGADMHRGNNVGETPLIRAVLVTNNSDQDAFPRLLKILGPSLRTVDEVGRTILHHAALVAGVKGRANSATYYMQSVLEYVARAEKGHFQDLVDAQDSNGDTALNIAAKIGNRGLVRMLLEVGADKVRANKLGLRPGDFGIEVQDLAVTAAEEAIASIRASPLLTAPALKSSEVTTSLNNLITSLTTDFELEVKAKTDQLETTTVQLRTATQELAAARQQITHWRAKVSEVDQRQQRIRNLQRAIDEEDSFDWTGRTEVDGQPALPNAGPGFTYRGPGSTLSNLPAGISIEFDADPPNPAADASNALVHLLRLEGWYERVMGLLDQRVSRLEGGEAELEVKLQKIVGNCCGVDPEKVEGMLEGLLAALESDGSTLEMSRVAAFLSRVKDGSFQ